MICKYLFENVLRYEKCDFSPTLQYLIFPHSSILDFPPPFNTWFSPTLQYLIFPHSSILDFPPLFNTWFSTTLQNLIFHVDVIFSDASFKSIGSMSDHAFTTCLIKDEWNILFFLALNWKYLIVVSLLQWLADLCSRNNEGKCRRNWHLSWFRKGCITYRVPLWIGMPPYKCRVTSNHIYT